VSVVRAGSNHERSLDRLRAAAIDDTPKASPDGSSRQGNVHPSPRRLPPPPRWVHDTASTSLWTGVELRVLTRSQPTPCSAI